MKEKVMGKMYSISFVKKSRKFSLCALVEFMALEQKTYDGSLSV